MSSGRLGRRFAALAASAVLACVGVLAVQGSLVFAAESEPSYLGGFGPDGTNTSDFEQVGSVAVDQETGYVYVGDTKKQALYKFDEAGQPVAFGGSEPYIAGNEITGTSFNPINGRSQLAVDSQEHVIYLTNGPSIRAFEENGEPHIFSDGPGVGTSQIPGFTEVAGVAVDLDGNIYISDRESKRIRIYSSDGGFLNEIETPTIAPANLAVDPGGDVIVVDNLGNRAWKFAAAESPVTSTTSYGQPELVEEQFTISVGVDPVTGFVYLTQQDLPNFKVTALDENGDVVGSLGDAGQEGELQGRPIGVAIHGEQRVYVSVKTESSPFHSKVEMFEAFAFDKGPPTITNSAVTGLSATAGTLQALINPNTFQTDYWFELGREDCSAAPSACSAIPLGAVDIGSGHQPVPVSQPIGQLLANTTYYFRVVAENVEGVTNGPVRRFVTQPNAFGFTLSDDRVWEQVSPTQKFGGGITNGTLVQAAADGSGIVFNTRGAIVADPDGNRALEASAALARREGGAQWHVEDLVPSHTKATQLGPGPEYKVFSLNLERGILEPRDTNPLSAEASEFTAYLRNNTTPPTYRPLVTSKEGFANVPPGTVFGGEVTGAKNPVALSAANDNQTDVVISSEAPLIPGAQIRALYHWENGSLTPVSELPADEGGEIVTAQVGSGAISVRHGVSNDGSRVFWSPGEPNAASENLPALYLRDTEAEETIRIDTVKGGSGSGTERPIFIGASADGSVVFFTDRQQLTADASPEGRSLYRCEIGEIEGSLGCVSLANLTVPLGGSESANAEEFTAAFGEDGDSIDFVATGVLDSQPNDAGHSAQSGQPNLYSWHEGVGVRFIATLSPEDRPDWGQPGMFTVGQMSGTSAYSSPNGRYLTFMSERNLTNDESNDPETGEPTESIFLYDSLTDKLSCVSCNPNGATDPAHKIVEDGSEGGLLFPDLQQLWAGRFVGATLPESTESEPTRGYSFYQPRAVLDNGRVFYNSVAPLVTADSNGTWDVYQYEPLGVGSCSLLSGGTSIARSGDGCVGLISSGADSKPSVFLDASQSGDDLFFMTFARLSVLDTDNIVDVYDARVNGVAAVAEPSQECQGEACQTRPPAPADNVPGSATFNGAGNVRSKPAKHCRKGQRKVKRKGKVKCVKKGKKGKRRGSSGAGK